MLSVYVVNPELDEKLDVPNWTRLTTNELLNRASGGTLTVNRPDRGPGSWWRLLWEPHSFVIVVDDAHTWAGYPPDRRHGSEQGTITLNSVTNLLATTDVTPSPDPADWSTATHRTYSGLAVEQLGQLVEDYRGATSPQRLEHFVVDTDGTLDANVNIQARSGLTPLDWVHLKGTPAGVVADVQWDETVAAIRCTIRAAVERPNVLFSPELSNISDYEVIQRQRTVDVVIVAGAGEGTSRLVTVRRLPPEEARTGWTRTVFADRRNIATLAELQAEGDEILAAGAPSTQIIADLIDGPDARYGVDYRLGDLVKIAVDDVEAFEPITEVTTEATADNGGAKVRRLKAGHGPINPYARTAAQVADLGRRVAQIEGAL